MTAFLSRGQIDVWLGLAPVVTNNQVLVGNSTVSELTLQAYSVGNKPAIINKDDLEHKSIIIIRGYTYGGWIEYIKKPNNQISFVETTSHESGLNMLKLGRGDYLLDYKAPVEYTLRTLEMSKVTVNYLSTFPVKFTVSRQHPKAQQLLDNLEASHRQLLAQEDNSAVIK